MSHNKAASYHSNGHNAQAACEHCEGIIRHERWCQTLNPAVCYAYKIVVSADELAIGDAIILVNTLNRVTRAASATVGQYVRRT